MIAKNKQGRIAKQEWRLAFFVLGPAPGNTLNWLTHGAHLLLSSYPESILLNMDRTAGHEKWSQEVADQLSRFLVMIYNGGIRDMLAVASSRAGKYLYFWPALTSFNFRGRPCSNRGQVIFSKHRELNRRDAAKPDPSEADTDRRRRSDTEDTISLFLVWASVVALFMLPGIKIVTWLNNRFKKDFAERKKKELKTINYF